MTRHIAEVPIARQHRQIMPNAKLRQQSINRPNLDAAASTPVAQLRGIDVVAPIGNQQWQGSKSLKYLIAIPRAAEPLQKLLQHQTGRDDRLARFDGPNQGMDFGDQGRRIAPERQGPHAGIDKQAQLRERSAL
jgi:hypothetical protein